MGDDVAPSGCSGRSRLIRSLFRELDAESVYYVLMHRYDDFPDGATNDLDVVILGTSLHSFEKCVHAVAKTHSWQLVKTSVFFCKRKYLWVGIHESGRLLSFELDVTVDRLIYRGIPLLSGADIVGARTKSALGPYVPESGMEGAILFTKEFYQLGQITLKFRERIQRHASASGDTLRAALEDYLGQSLATSLLHVLSNGKWDFLKANARQVRRRLIWRSFARRPFGQLLDWFRFLWGHFSARILHPSGLFICLIGPDGSGKTTVARGLQKSMGICFNGTEYYHGRVGILPELKTYGKPLRRFLGREDRGDSCKGIPDTDSPAFRFPRALVYVLYYALDNLLGHLVITHATNRGSLVIFDRYYYDYMMQPSFLSIPRSVLRAIQAVLPRPDILIWLRNEPDVIFRRKQELPTEAIRAQNKVCARIVAATRKAWAVETNTCPNVTLRRIQKIVFDTMERTTS